MSLEKLDRLEIIDPRALPPWRPEAFKEIEFEPDQEIARGRALAIRATWDIVVYYSDARRRHDSLGAGVVTLDKEQEVTPNPHRSAGPIGQWSVHVFDLIEIFCAISLVCEHS